MQTYLPDEGSSLDHRTLWLREYRPYDVFLNHPRFTEAIVMRRLPAYSMVGTNVPHTIIHHSPNGFDFGYMGSAPADLALNIVEELLRLRGFTGRRVACYHGDCFEVAFLLHQDFKEAFIAGMDQNGGLIPYEVAQAWLDPYFAVNSVIRGEALEVVHG